MGFEIIGGGGGNWNFFKKLINRRGWNKRGGGGGGELHKFFWCQRNKETTNVPRPVGFFLHCRLTAWNFAMKFLDFSVNSIQVQKIEKKIEKF